MSARGHKAAVRPPAVLPVAWVRGWLDDPPSGQSRSPIGRLDHQARSRPAIEGLPIAAVAIGATITEIATESATIPQEHSGTLGESYLDRHKKRPGKSGLGRHRGISRDDFWRS